MRRLLLVCFVSVMLTYAVVAILPTFPFHVQSDRGYFEWENNNPNISLIGIFPNKTIARNHTLDLSFVNIQFTQNENDTSVKTFLPYTINFADYKSNWTTDYTNNTEGQNLNYTIYDPVAKVRFRISYYMFYDNKTLPIVPTKFDFLYVLLAGTAKYSFSVDIDKTSFLYDPEHGVNLTQTLLVSTSQSASLTNVEGVYGQIPTSVMTQWFTWNITFPRYGLADGVSAKMRAPFPIPTSSYAIPVVEYFYIMRSSYEYDPDLSIIFTGVEDGSNPVGDGAGAGDGTGNPGSSDKQSGGSNTKMITGVVIGVVAGAFICVIIAIVIISIIIWKREQISQRARDVILNQNMRRATL